MIFGFILAIRKVIEFQSMSSLFSLMEMVKSGAKKQGHGELIEFSRKVRNF